MLLLWYLYLNTSDWRIDTRLHSGVSLALATTTQIDKMSR